MSLNELQQFIQASHPKSIEYSFNMGYDCGIHGANETNCHFSIFFSKEATHAWELGKYKAAMEARGK
jgi:hypothetical protein